MELHTLIFFRGRQVVADARVTKVRLGLALRVPCMAGSRHSWRHMRCSTCLADAFRSLLQLLPSPALAPCHRCAPTASLCLCQSTASKALCTLRTRQQRRQQQMAARAPAAAAAGSKGRQQRRQRATLCTMRRSRWGGLFSSCFSSHAPAFTMQVTSDACLQCRSPASEMRLLSRSPALQTVRSKDGSTHYTVFDKCAVRCELATVARHSWGPASWRFWLCSCRS